MKGFLKFLFAGAVAGVATACIMDERVGKGQGSGAADVEIAISTSGGAGSGTRGLSGTRAVSGMADPLGEGATEYGHDNESTIAELDVLVFAHADDGSGGYLYRRAAALIPESSTVGKNVYRVTMVESTDQMDIHILANCRALLTQWGGGDDDTSKKGLSWADVNTALADANPARLVGQGTFTPLPMYGTISGVRLDPESAPTRWPADGKVELLRAVASFDLFVEQTTATERFELGSLSAWYAPSSGLVGAEITSQRTANPGTALERKDNIFRTPADMTTSLNTMQASGVTIYHAGDIAAQSTKSFAAIDYQVYTYDNPATTIADDGDNRRPTRLIMGGKWDGKAAFYPIDITENSGEYRPVVRNFKYEFAVTAVTGPGYPTLPEAAAGATVNLQVDVILWNRDDVMIGVKGKYYVSMEKKEVTLFRNAGDSETLSLTYQQEEGEPGVFSIALGLGEATGEPQVVTEGAVTTTTLASEWFEIVMIQNEAAGTVEFTVTALRDYSTPEAASEVIVVTYRDLRFDIAVTQLPLSEQDWIDGGDQNYTAGE